MRGLCLQAHLSDQFPQDHRQLPWQAKMTARILVVDDILANVRLLEAKLSAEYFEVVTAMNGVDALEAVQRAKPDIVLLDVMMPGIDAIEVCKRLKADA